MNPFFVIFFTTSLIQLGCNSHLQQETKTDSQVQTLSSSQSDAKAAQQSVANEKKDKSINVSRTQGPVVKDRTIHIKRAAGAHSPAEEITIAEHVVSGERAQVTVTRSIDESQTKTQGKTDDKTSSQSSSDSKSKSNSTLKKDVKASLFNISLGIIWFIVLGAGVLLVVVPILTGNGPAMLSWAKRIISFIVSRFKPSP